MKQFVLPADYGGEREIVVTGEDFHYLRRVRRLGEGDRLAGRGRNGEAYDLTVIGVGERCMRLRVISPSADDSAADGPAVVDSPPSAPAPPITLYQCLAKGGTFDRIVRQAVETGVERIIPVASAHAVKRVDGAERSAGKLARWRRIAEEAVQQSGRGSLPTVEPVRSLQEIETIGGEPAACGLVFHEKALADRRPGDYLWEGLKRIAVVIGPEGGLADHEVTELEKRGFEALTLGPHVLRTETAAVYAVAAVQSVFRELSAWKQ